MTLVGAGDLPSANLLQVPAIISTATDQTTGLLAPTLSTTDLIPPVSAAIPVAPLSNTSPSVLGQSEPATALVQSTVATQPSVQDPITGRTYSIVQITDTAAIQSAINSGFNSGEEHILFCRNATWIG